MMMKKMILAGSVLAIVAIACHKKAVPVVTDRTVQPAPPTSTVSTPPAPKPDSAAVVYEAADITAGKTVYETKCNRCHEAKPVGNYTVQRWPGLLRSMIPRSKLTEAETRQVTAYVMTNAKK